MFYFVMAFFLLMLILFAFHLGKHDLFSPSVLCLGGLLLSTMFAIIGRATWNNVNISYQTALIVCGGALAFFMGSALVEHLDDRSSGGYRLIIQRSASVSWWKYSVLLCLLLLALVFRLFDTYRIAGELGVSTDNFSLMVKSVRDATANYLPSADGMQAVEFSTLVKQLDKLAKAVGYVALFLLASEIQRFHPGEKKNRRVISIALPASIVVIDWAYVILCGGRTQIMYMGIAFAALLFMQFAAGRKDRFRISLITLVIILALGLFAVCAFYFGGYIIGRAPSGGIVDYTTFYFGGGTPSLDKLMHDQATFSKCDGATFYNIRAFLAKFGIVAAPGSSSIAWVGFPGHLSNIYTAFGGLYIDFGLIGMMLLTVLSGAICTLIYVLARRSCNPYLLMICGYFAPSIFDMARIEFVFNSLISVNQLLIIGLMVVLLWFMLRRSGDHHGEVEKNV